MSSRVKIAGWIIAYFVVGNVVVLLAGRSNQSIAVALVVALGLFILAVLVLQRVRRRRAADGPWAEEPEGGA